VPYLTLAEFKNLTTMPDTDVDGVETKYPGWIANQLAYWSSWIDARLRKRYDAPFTATPYPPAVQGWLERIVTVRVFIKRGVDPNDLQFAEIKATADSAFAEIKEAADSDVGLFDLPLLPSNVSGIVMGSPRGYSEQSPYVWMDRQVDTGRNEDRNRGGSGG
jgi:hypothetical protein